MLLCCLLLLLLAVGLLAWRAEIRHEKYWNSLTDEQKNEEWGCDQW